MRITVAEKGKKNVAQEDKPEEGVKSLYFKEHWLVFIDMSSNFKSPNED